ncbi:DUF4192 family protein [Cellulomonas sp. Leaf395]|uniref:DUF4192 family protein n=1 Tax=Cellulomonas sp. Leaf395 TaxID=1736362 RepID=UPI00138F328A|nr:DUF4192 family protein [Cellulomonas sp. Leaf395]
MSTTRSALVRSVIDQLGFEPEESLALVLVAADTSYGGTIARLDLSSLEDTDIRIALFDRLSRPFHVANASAVHVLYFSTRPFAQLRPMDRDLDQFLDAHAITRASTTVVDETISDAPRRVDIARLDPADADVRAVVDGWTEQADDVARVYDTLRRLAAHGCRRLPPPLLGRLALGIEHGAHRDAILVMILGADHDTARLVADGCADDATIEQALDPVLSSSTGVRPPASIADDVTVLTALARALPTERTAPCRTLLGLIAWWSGDGALADRHLQEALSARPGYRLAVLLHMLVAGAVPPGWVHRDKP